MNFASEQAAKLKAQATEEAKKKIEQEMGEQAPGWLKPCFPVCGGPVNTIDRFQFVVAEEARPKVKEAIEKYRAL